MKQIILLLALVVSLSALAQNVGVGTTTPGTKLDVNGAITLRETTVPVSGNSATIPSNVSQVRLTGAATGAITLTGPAAPPNAGQQLVIYNNTTGGYAATYAGASIADGSAMTFAYSNATWVPTGSGGPAANIYNSDGTLSGNRTVTMNAGNLTFNATSGNFVYDAGTGSVNMGNGNTASGTNSTALGTGTSATDTASTAMGNITQAIGVNSTAMGYGTAARSFSETALGSFNTFYYPSSETLWVSSDRLVDIGNGVPGVPSDAMVILKNGNVGIGTSTPFNTLEVVGSTKTTNLQMTSGAANGYILQSDVAGNGSWVNPTTVSAANIYNTNGTLTASRIVTMGADNMTFSAVNGNFIYSTTGNGSVNMGNGNTASGANSTALGFNTSASNITSTAMGNYSAASGQASTAMGNYTQAGGENSTAMGSQANANGKYSTAMGNFTYAGGYFSTAMGNQSDASGDTSTAMGFLTRASGNTSTAMGLQTTASGAASTAMGNGTTASGASSTALGLGTHASGQGSVAMGAGSTASGFYSLASGRNCTASGDSSIALGFGATASGNASVSAGYQTVSSASSTVAMGFRTIASGSGSTAVGTDDTASGFYSTSMCYGNNASGNSSTAMGNRTSASGSSSTTMGSGTAAKGVYSTAMGRSTTASGDTSVAMGAQTTASGNASTATGIGCIASGATSFAGGFYSNATNIYSVAMGFETNATGSSGTSMGAQTTASGDASTAMGNGTTASAESSTAMGILTIARGQGSVAMGAGSIASGFYSLAEGRNCTASGDSSVALGFANTASGSASIAIGSQNVANNYNSVALGTYTTSSGLSSVSLGYNTTASSQATTAMGFRTTASNINSTASGNYSIASGAVSTALGDFTTASGSSSTAMGEVTTASGNNSTSMGYETSALSFSETAMGAYNTSYTPSSTTAWVGTDRLLGVGNGTFTTPADALVILKNGRVGIGTATPASLLYVGSGTTAVGALAGLNVAVGGSSYITASDGTRTTFMGADNNGYGMAGTLSNHDFVIRSNNTERMRIAAGGFVGIGTSSPNAPLHIGTAGSSGITTASLARSYFYGGSGTSVTENTNASGNIMVQADGWYWANGGGYVATSDARIKNIAGETDNACDLQTLAQIKITDYKYIDQAANGNKPQKKVIAQQVRDVYPQAISRMEGIIPDVYDTARSVMVSVASTTIGTVRPHGFKTGDEVKLICENGDEKTLVVAVNDSYTFSVPQPLKGRIFVYGKKVDDLLTVDYDAISMLNVSATQELYRQLTSAKAQEQVLAGKIAAQQLQIDAQQTQIENLVNENVQIKSAKADATELEQLKAEVGTLKAYLYKQAPVSVK